MVSRIITLLWTATIYILLWMPLPGDSSSPVGQMDLLVHLGLFLLLGGLGLYTIKPKGNWKRWTLWGSYMIFVALTSELGQYFFPTRTVAPADLLVNHLGLFAAVITWELEEDYLSRLSGITGASFLMLGTGGTVTIIARIFADWNTISDGNFLFYAGIITALAGWAFIFRKKPAIIWRTTGILGITTYLALISTPSHPLFLLAGGIILLLFGLTIMRTERAIKVIRRHLGVPFIICWYLLGILPVQTAARLAGIIIIHVYFLLLFTYCLQKRFNYLQTVIPEQVSPE